MSILLFYELFVLWDGVSFCKTNISHKELSSHNTLSELTELISKAITDGNLKKFRSGKLSS